MNAILSLRSSLLALGIAVPALAAGFALAQGAAPTSKVLAKVDGVEITEADVAVAAEDPALQLSQVPEAQRRDLLVGYLVDLKLGARAAEAAKVGDGADFARKVAYARDKALLDTYLDQESKKAVTPEAARKLYDETVKSVPAEQEVRARHILVANEDDAKKAATRVKGGEDFAKVAGELSKDPGSKTDGGDLGGCRSGCGPCQGSGPRQRYRDHGRRSCHRGRGLGPADAERARRAEARTPHWLPDRPEARRQGSRSRQGRQRRRIRP